MDNIPEGYCQCGCGRYIGHWHYTNRSQGRIKGEPKQFVSGHNRRLTQTEWITPADYRERWQRLYPDIPYGYCICGCGQQTSIAAQHHPTLGHVRGEPVYYVFSHSARQSRKNLDHYIHDNAYRVQDCGYGSACWIWLGSVNHHGYGQIGSSYHSISAHRAFYERTYGTLSIDYQLHHLCANKPCVRPDHLQALLPKAHYRLHSAKKLTSFKADEIRRRYANGGITQRALAKEYDVAQAQIWRILKGLRWA